MLNEKLRFQICKILPNLGKELLYSLKETIRTFNRHLKETFEIDTGDFRLSASNPKDGEIFGTHVILDNNKEILERLMENPYILDLSHLCWDILSATTGAQLYKYYKRERSGMIIYSKRSSTQRF